MMGENTGPSVESRAERREGQWKRGTTATVLLYQKTSHVMGNLDPKSYWGA